MPLTENRTLLWMGHTGLCPWKTRTICKGLRRRTRLTETGIPSTLPKLFYSQLVSGAHPGAHSGYEPPHRPAPGSSSGRSRLGRAAGHHLQRGDWRDGGALVEERSSLRVLKRITLNRKPLG